MRILLGVVALVAWMALAEAYYSSTWYEDAAGWEEAVREQRAHHAPLLVYFRVDWCPHCRAFDQLAETYEVRSRLSEVIKVRINPEHGGAEKALQARYGASGYPAVFVQRDGGPPAALSTQGPAARFVSQLPAE